MDKEWKNKLWYGDNLEVLRMKDKDGEVFPSNFVDLIYLDPPFNSNATYNMLFKEKDGKDSQAQLEAFTDSWDWVESTNYYFEELVMNTEYADLANLMIAFEKFLGKNSLTAYLVMMSIRLIELHRVLKPTGSLYLHCDPTASHYIKLVLDAVFGIENFRNEIVWKRTNVHNYNTRVYGRVTDTIFWYSKTSSYMFQRPSIEHKGEYLESAYRHTDPDGKRYRLHDVVRTPSLGTRPNLIYEFKGYTPQYGFTMIKEKLEELDRQGRIVWSKTGRPMRKLYLDDVPPATIGNLWDDIILCQGKEKMGYPTQKPEALLERIIKASSNEGDLVLDPFCGCGTTVAVAERLKRRWIGIDITWLSVFLMEKRLKDSFEHGYVSELAPYEVLGAPKDLASAIALAERDKYQFQYWAVSLVGATPYQGGKKGADTGIDGMRYFKDMETGGERQTVIVQVKGGKHVSSPHIRDLSGVLTRENAAIGVYLCLTEPTDEMIKEKNKAGLYKTPLGKMYPKIQILTIEDILVHGKNIEIPFKDDTGHTPYKRAQSQFKDKPTSKKLFD